MKSEQRKIPVTFVPRLIFNNKDELVSLGTNRCCLILQAPDKQGLWVESLFFLFLPAAKKPHWHHRGHKSLSGWMTNNQKVGEQQPSLSPLWFLSMSGINIQCVFKHCVCQWSWRCFVLFFFNWNCFFSNNKSKKNKKISTKCNWDPQVFQFNCAKLTSDNLLNKTTLLC